MCMFVCVCNYSVFMIYLSIYLCNYVYVFTQTLHHWQDVTQGQFLRSKACLNSEFSISLTGCLSKAKEPSLPYYLLIDEFMPFSGALAWFKTQTASSSILNSGSQFHFLW